MVANTLESAMATVCGMMLRRWRWHRREARALMDADRARRVVEHLEPRMLLSGYGFDFPGEVPPNYMMGATGMSVADVNGDGILDWITVDNHPSNKVWVRHGLGNATYGPALTYAVGTRPNSVTAADVDGDKRLDLITASYGIYPNTPATVSVLRNNGDGTFAAQVAYPVKWNASSVAAADLNGDGKVELITANGDSPQGSSTVSVFQNNGDGTFAPQVIYQMGGAYQTAVAAADVNGDGKVDLAVARPHFMSVLRNNGDGTFANPINYPMTKEPLFVVAADVDGDGKLDLVTANKCPYPNYSGTASVLRNNGDGTFGAEVCHVVGGYPNSVTTADVHGDGIVDIVVADYQRVSVLRNKGDGNFIFEVAYAAGSSGVAATDVNGDAKVDLLTTCSVLLNRGDGTFAAPVSYIAGDYSASVVAADFNGDGRLDVSTAEARSSNLDIAGTVTVRINKGNGIFKPLLASPVGVGPASMTAADVDGDGKMDLVTANYGSNTVSVLRNNGDGTFAAQVPYAVGGQPGSVRAADVDSDGNMDLITANYGPDTVSVLRNNGNGSFAAPATYAAGSGLSAVEAVDMNKDGMVDLVTANTGAYPDYLGTVSVLQNNGDGTFAAQVVYEANIQARLVAAADVNGDGKVDLVTAIYNATLDSGTLLVRWNNGDGTFATSLTYEIGYVPRSLVVADVNGDGKSDLVVASQSQFSQPGMVSVLRNKGDGTFAPQIGYPVGHNPVAVVADLNGDGTLDLIAAGASTMSVLWNNGDSTFAAYAAYGAGRYPNSVAAADVNGDGKVDLITASSTATPVSVVRNNGDGTFAVPVIYTASAGAACVTAADVNGDGKVDLITANSTANTVSVLRNNGDGTFAAPVSHAVGARASSVTAADVNGDGKMDLITANSTANTVSVLRNNGDGTFAAPVSHAVGARASSVTPADVNGDGKVDLITANSTANTVSVLQNDGDGTFASQVTYAVGTNPVCVVAADVNGDGNIDIITANSASDGSVSVLQNNGNGTFAGHVSYAVGRNPVSVVAADVSGDGKPDLAIANDYNTMSVLRNEGSGIFATQIVYSVGSSPRSVVAADVNGDGRLDLVTADYDLDTICVLTNTGTGPTPGDANVDGRIDADDYFRIDAGFLGGLAGWANGDFNRDGRIDIDDYFLIDQAYARQPGPPAAASRAAPQAGLFGDSAIAEEDLLGEEP